MARMLIVIVMVAFVSLSICGTFPLAKTWQTDDYQTGAADTKGIAAPPGLLYLCENNAAEEEAAPVQEEGETDSPDVDRLWNVVMYG